MARTRAQRRRHEMYLTIALVVTLVVLLFARDVSRSAHGAIGPRRSENRSFGQLANDLVSQENDFDARLAALLSQGRTLTRSVFAARLDQLDQQLPLWATEARQLRGPRLAHDINDVIVQVTEQRIDAYQSMLTAVATQLTLPWTSAPAPAQVVVSPAQALVATSREWGIERWSLAREPGRVVLGRLTSVSAALVGSTGYAPLLGVPSLALTRGIGIVAVSIDPSPLPARAGELLLPPVSSVHLGVSVENAAYVEQPVTLLIRFQPTNGLVQSQTLTATLGPLASFAFVPDQLTTSASERGTLRVTVSGAPAGATLALTRTYRVVMSPSGNG